MPLIISVLSGTHANPLRRDIMKDSQLVDAADVVACRSWWTSNETPNGGATRNNHHHLEQHHTALLTSNFHSVSVVLLFLVFHIPWSL